MKLTQTERGYIQDGIVRLEIETEDHLKWLKGTGNFKLAKGDGEKLAAMIAESEKKLEELHTLYHKTWQFDE